MSKKIHKKSVVNTKKDTSRVVFAERKKPELFIDCKQNLFLYRFVYNSGLSFFVVFLLLISFFVQGANVVHADDSLAPEVVEEEFFDIADDTSEINLSTENSSNAEINLDGPADDQQDSEEPIDSVIEESTDIESLTELDQESEEETATTSDTATSSDEGSEPESEPEDETEDESEDVEEVVVEELEPAETTHETVSVTQSDMQVTFNKDECTELATGSFYCLQPTENQLQDALFAATDNDGDMEIFLVRAGEQIQVTSNQTDDSAPYYDPNTNTIVWHRMINDRYQVISYDIETGEETQLTSTTENNMEPTRQGEYTVWQRWVSGGWNIILFDGEDEIQITDTTSHNVAPYIHGSLIVWNRHALSGEKTIEMFDINSETYVTVEDPDGLSVSNPRMVFVYDSLHPNGDIVTKGYDVLARKFIDLGTLPRQLPEQLPDSDSTGETRALIQSKPNIKSEVEESLHATSTPGAEPLPTPPSLATTTESLTLDMTVSSSSFVQAPTPVPEPVDLGEFDLVIDSFDGQSSTTKDVPPV